MKRKLGYGLMALGTVLLLAALGIFFHNQRESARAGASADAILAQMEAQAAVQTQPEAALPPQPVETQIQYEAAPTSPEAAGSAAAAEPAIQPVLDGASYLGWLTIPAMEKKLPVLNSWDDDLLKLSPCRYYGSAETDDLVIVAHNYVQHFGSLGSLTIGDPVYLTDLEGNTIAYEVLALEALDDQDVENMIAGEYDLTLFTCTYTRESRLTVRCDRAAQEDAP